MTPVSGFNLSSGETEHPEFRLTTARPSWSADQCGDSKRVEPNAQPDVYNCHAFYDVF
jgi:hypothetical protein